MLNAEVKRRAETGIWTWRDLVYDLCYRAEQVAVRALYDRFL